MNKGYKLKHRNRDFCVSEVSQEPKRCDIYYAQHTLVELTKYGVSAFDAVDIISKILSINSNYITYSGLKDKSGVTTQLVAIKGKYPQGVLNAVAQKTDRKINLVGKGYSKEPLKIGKLYGNNFRIVLRDIDKRHFDRLMPLDNKTIISPTVNYYDNQRFGLRGILNSHIIGKCIYEGDWKQAVEEFLRSGSHQSEKNVIRRFLKNGASSEEAFRQSQDNRKLAFFLGANSSFEWNEEIVELLRRQQQPGNLIEFDNDLMKLLFLRNPNMIKAGSTHHPYFYYTTKDGRNFPETISQRPIILNNRIHVSHVANDELFKGKLKTQLDFFLQSGNYATMAVKQFMSRVIDPKRERE
jgi:tRNA pseudouridine13 synthase